MTADLLAFGHRLYDAVFHVFRMRTHETDALEPLDFIHGAQEIGKIQRAASRER